MYTYYSMRHQKNKTNNKKGKTAMIQSAKDILINGPILPKGFGEGWASKNASDLIRIAITMLGLDGKLFLKALFTEFPKVKKIQERHVAHILDVLDYATRTDKTKQTNERAKR